MSKFYDIELLKKESLALFKPPPRLLISNWAEQFRRLSPESSAEPGQWRNSRAPYLKGIMDAISADQKVIVMSSSQVGKTELLLNTLGYFMDLDPCPIMLLEPTIEMAQTVSKDRIAPMIRDSPKLTGLVGNRRARDSENTILHKTFAGGHITLAGANSSASLASRPIRILLIDECDRFPFSAGREGDPISLAAKRTTTFWNRKIVIVSTPTVSGLSRIELEYSLSNQQKYFVPCPKCDQKQVLIWAQVKFTTKNTQIGETCLEAWYECQFCKNKITDADKPYLLENGEWRATSESDIQGFHIWQAYSPWGTFKEIVDDFLKAKRDKELFKVWTNTCLGETFDEQGGESPEIEDLLSRRESYPLFTAPSPVILTAGIDIQKDRIVCSVWGWGRDEEGWLIAHEEMFGEPTDKAVWDSLEVFINRGFRYKDSDNLFYIQAACIDSGFLSQEVYNFVRHRPKFFAIKGASVPNKPIVSKPTYQEVNYNGKLLKRGVRLWTLGVHGIKTIIYSRLRIIAKGAGYLHFPVGIGQDYFEQLTAENLVTKYNKGFPKTEWVKIRDRNEALDCAVYAYAAAQIIGLPRYDFDALEKSLEQEKAEEKVSTAKRTNWVKNKKTVIL